MKSLFLNKEAEKLAEKLEQAESDKNQLIAMNKSLQFQVKDVQLELRKQGERLIEAQSHSFENENNTAINIQTQEQLQIANDKVKKLGEENQRIHLELRKAIQTRDNNMAAVVRIKKQRDRLRALQSVE